MFRMLALSLGLAVASASQAQDRRPSHCIAIADAAPGIEYLQLASITAPCRNSLCASLISTNAMFLIQTPGGLGAVTDYSGYIGATGYVPDIVTMNHAHGTHWTPSPDPAIRHVLRGWGDTPAGADHHLDLGEMLIRNVPTDIRSRFGGRLSRTATRFSYLRPKAFA